MLRYCILLLCCTLSTLLPAQNEKLGFQIGFGTSYDYGIELPDIPGFAPYTHGRTGAFSFDAFLGIPVGRLTVYPSCIFSIPSRSMTIQNLNGDYIPAGYSVSLPYSTSNPYVIFGENYYDLSARAEIWERKMGAFALFHVGGGLELGSGLFQRRKTVTTYAPVFYDEYWYSYSNGTKTDEYSYVGSYSDYVEMDEFRDNSLTVPLVLQWRYQGDAIFYGTSITRWVGGGDNFWSFRYTMGVHF